MRRILLLAALPLHAHMVSLSTGDILVEGRFATYELRMPIYEIQHVKDPEPALFANIHFRSSGVEARLREKSCSVDAPSVGPSACTGSSAALLVELKREEIDRKRCSSTLPFSRSSRFRCPDS